MRRGPKIALIVVGSIFVGGGVLAFAAYQFSRTRSGSEFILARANGIAAKYGVQLSYSKGEIDPFSYLRFDNLKVIKGAGDDRLEVFVRRIDVKYSLSVLGRSVDVEHARVEAPAVLFRKISSIVEPVPEPVRGAPSGIETARKYVVSPPAKVRIKNFALTDLSVDAEMRNPEGGMLAKIPSASMSATFDLAGSEIGFTSEAKLGPGSSIKLISKQGDTQSEIETSPYADMKIAGEVRRRDGKWRYEIKPSEIVGGAQYAAFANTADDKRTGGRFETMKLHSDLKLIASTAELFQLDRDSLQTIECHGSLTIGPGSFEDMRFGPQKATFVVSRPNGVQAALTYAMSEIASKKFLRKPIRLEAKATGLLAKDLSKANAEGSAAADGIRVASFDAETTTGDGVNFHAKALATLSAKLQALLKPEAGAGMAGVVRANASLSGKLEGRYASLADLTPTTMAGATAAGEAKAEFTQEDKRGAKAVFEPVSLVSHFRGQKEKVGFNASLKAPSGRFDKIVFRDLAFSVDGELGSSALKAKMAGGLAELKGAPLLRPIVPTLTAALEWNDGKSKFEGTAKIDGESVASFQGTSRADGRKQQIETTIDAFLGEYVAAFLPKAQWDEYGRWQSKTSLTVETESPVSPRQTFADHGTLRAGGSTVVSQAKAAEPKGHPISMKEPIEITHKFELDRGKKNADLTLDIPSLEIVGKATIGGTKAHATLRSADPTRPKDGDLEIALQQGEIVIAEEMSRERPTLQGLDLAMKANVRGGGDRFTMESFAASFNRGMVKLTAEASGRLRTKDFQMSGKLSAEIPKNFPPIADQQIHGRVELPWTLSVLRGRELALDGDLSVNEVSWAKGVRRVSGISGKIPLSEKLLLENGKFRFAYLIDQNPFERVDFERIRPLITRADQVRIQAIGFEEKTYGPFVGFFSMRQNLLFAHQFDFTIGNSGLAYGELYFNVYPDNLQLGFLSRLTALNLEDVLPRKFLVKVPKGDKNISARSGLVINLNRGSIDGRIDITEIGASQLITLINALDPKFEDEKMNLARTALGIGYPTFVQMSLQKGFLDMGVDISALGISQRFDIRGIPVSTWVSAATSGIVKKTQESSLGGVP